uniref:Deoxynucleoside kinase domain-containing protein n=1 Tax=viral metagenome TaxID=1070528 RepID=A0A6C0KEJ9_9ZZZZ
MAPIISIEGNIGSGKSTFVSYLRSTLSDDYVFLEEPVDTWNTIRDESDNTILTKFYQDRKRYAFSFQMLAYISRLVLLLETVKKFPNKTIITERSVLTDRNVFAKMLSDDGEIEHIEHCIYLQWFDYFIKDIHITHVVYVKTDPVTCEGRIAKRNREGEDIPLDYLSRCGSYHDDWLCSEENSFAILNIDGNTDISDNPDALKEWSIALQEWACVGQTVFRKLEQKTNPPVPREG